MYSPSHPLYAMDDSSLPDSIPDCVRPGWTFIGNDLVYTGPPWLGPPHLDPELLGPILGSARPPPGKIMSAYMELLHGGDGDDTQPATSAELAAIGRPAPKVSGPWYCAPKRMINLQDIGTSPPSLLLPILPSPQRHHLI